MLVQLNVTARNFKVVTTYLESFESTKIKNLRSNQNSAGLPALTGNAEFIYEVDGGRNIHYVTTESVSAITALTGGTGSPSNSGSAATGWTAVEYGSGTQHRTVLTRDSSLAQTVASAALGFGEQLRELVGCIQLSPALVREQFQLPVGFGQDILNIPAQLFDNLPYQPFLLLQQGRQEMFGRYLGMVLRLRHLLGI